jgi:hypothetical protein
MAAPRTATTQRQNGLSHNRLVESAAESPHAGETHVQLSDPPGRLPSFATVPGMERQEQGVCPECHEPALIRYAQLSTEDEGDLIERLDGVECQTEGCTNFMAPPRIG